jgi:uncharacterized UBP type Zn finger protein
MNCPTGCISNKKNKINGNDTKKSRKPKRKISHKPKRKISSKPKRKISRKPKRKISRKPKRKISHKPKRKISSKPKRKISRKPKRKISRKPKNSCILPTTKGNRVITGMNNIGNTCYMDSVLFPIVVNPTSYFKKTIFKPIANVHNQTPQNQFRQLIRNELVRLHNSIRDVNIKAPNVAQLKGSLNTQICKRLKNVINMHRYRDYSQEDAGEFLQSLSELFEMYGLEYTRITYGTNSLAKNVRKSNITKTSEFNAKDKESVVYTVTSDILDDFGPTREPVKISRLLKTKMDSGELDSNNLFTPDVNGVKVAFKRRITVKQVLDSPCLLFYIVRPFRRYNMFGQIEEEGVNRKRVLCTQKIKLKSNKILKLNAIVVHVGSVGGGHYVVYFKCKNNWFLYDDINQMNKSTRTRFIGSYENLMKSRKIYGKMTNIKTHGIIYYYI